MNEPVSPLAGAPAGPSSAFLLEDEAGALLRLAPSSSPDGLLASVRARMQEDPSARALRGLSLRVDFGDQLPEPLTLRRLLVMLRGEFSVGISGLRCTPEALQRYAERTLQVPVRLSGGNLLPEMFEGPPPGLDALDQWLGLLSSADLRCAPAAPAIEETPSLAEVPEESWLATEDEFVAEAPGLDLPLMAAPAEPLDAKSEAESPSNAALELAETPEVAEAEGSAGVDGVGSPGEILGEVTADPAVEPAGMVSSAPIQAGTPEATTPGIAPSSVIETDNGQDDLELDAALPSEVALVNEGPTAITQVSAVTPAEIPADLFRAERPGDDQPWWVREGDRRVLAISRTLRSGASVRFPGDVVVYGDVNAGAEIEAGGNIVVLGSLRGLAHAGAQGESEAIVLAFDLRPAQLRISDQIYFPATASKAPGLLSLLGRDRAKTSGFQPMLAMIRSGVIHLEDWRGKLPF